MKSIELENKHLSTFFFFLFILFFILFVWNKYTMNIIMCFIWLILAVGFKTWQISREIEEKVAIIILRERW